MSLQLLVVLSLFTSGALQTSTNLSPRVVYVDPVKGIMDPDCLTGGKNLPCKDDLSKKDTLYLKPKYYKVEVKSYKNITCKHLWMYESNGTCLCGDGIHGSVICKRSSVFIQTCSCLTYDTNAGVLVGPCPYGCGFTNSSWGGELYHPLPVAVSRVNDAMCGWLKRDGRLCSKCRKGFSPLVYSYDLYCIKCSSKYNWLKFIIAAFLPLTIFYFIAILFRINATNPYLYGFITINQAIGAPINLRAVLTVINGRTRFTIRLLSMTYSIWNLDYFRSLPLNICLNLSTLQTLALDYAIAVYPLILVAVTYLLIELHARGCRIMLCLWSPFHRCCVRFTRIMDIQSSIIKAFATFFLLSYIKLLNSTADMLLPVKTYNLHRKAAGIYVYYDASYKYFGKDHLPYAIMAILFFMLFVLSPLVLLLFYQASLFQKCLNTCKIKCHALEVFVGAFQGHYKDGTEPGTRDYRWFAAIYFLGRIIIVYLIFGYSQDIMCYSLCGITLLFWGILIITLQPYKLRKINAYHASVLLYLAATCFSVTAFDLATIKAQWSINAMMFIILTFAVLPTLIVVVYMVSRAIHKCYKEGKQCFSQKCKELRIFMQASKFNINMHCHENDPLHPATIRSYQAV